MARLVEVFGEPVAVGKPELTRSTVTAERIADASVARIRTIGLPESRATTIWRLAGAVARGELRLDPDADAAVVMQQLVELPGIGPWTAEYVAMRALHCADAFPASDLVLRRNGGGLTASRLTRVAERWRPWRAYAAMQLWLQGPP
jgi:AraC family transcriptional regulator, regulatory protein of adaptative response / DNA-3-methyladenine glycosylase II